MRTLFFTLVISILCITVSVKNGNSAKGRNIFITHEQKAQTAYNKGFAKGVMRDGRDSVKNYVWNLHNGKNRLEMRAKSDFGVCGHPGYIECNFVPKPIPKQVSIGSID